MEKGHVGHPSEMTDKQWSKYLKDLIKHLENAQDYVDKNKYWDKIDFKSEFGPKNEMNITVLNTETGKEDKKLYKKFKEEEKKLAKFREKELCEAFNMLNEHFYDLWD